MNADVLTEVNTQIAIVAKFVEVFGVLTIIIGGLHAVFRFLLSKVRKLQFSYEDLRGSLGRAILLGLEFLVAGDIIGTVAVEPTFKSLGVLGIIVMIRTFLSFSLEVEIKGRWPWQKERPHE